MNGAYLVAESETARFHTLLAELAARYEPEGLDFEMTGPWPPYNFVRLNVSPDNSPGGASAGRRGHRRRHFRGRGMTGGDGRIRDDALRQGEGGPAEDRLTLLELLDRVLDKGSSSPATSHSRWPT